MKAIDIQALAGRNSLEQLKSMENRDNKNKRTGFEKLLTDSIKQANSLQLQANKAVQQLATGANENIHETMIAIEKAGVSFQMMMQIRNKIIDAYQEIMKTSM